MRSGIPAQQEAKVHDAMIRERFPARGLSDGGYMGGNLLGLEVRTSEVADAFVALALMAAPWRRWSVERPSRGDVALST
jgi:hypothetical protein